MKRAFCWLPRILSVLFIAFISVFALDVFSEPQWFLALFMHLIPSYFLIVITIVAWKHEVLGGFLFLIAGFALLLFTHFEALIIGIPVFIIGLLFLLTKRLYKAKGKFQR
jgi:signal transduction histidine kinase